ncbi:MAG: hypothetical protein LBE04_01860 [Prevotellaceae bacterium]|jgi:hypothetical protein|nr:hypothetical protein [Prevotellaceae bacterium]
MAGTLTKYEALLGELEPYSPSALTLKKSLADVGIAETEWNKEYAAESDKTNIAKAAISVLKRMIVLSSDSMGKTSQGYSVDELRKRIRDLATENGFDISDFDKVPAIIDGSMLW